MKNQDKKTFVVQGTFDGKRWLNVADLDGNEVTFQSTIDGFGNIEHLPIFNKNLLAGLKKIRFAEVNNLSCKREADKMTKQTTNDTASSNGRTPDFDSGNSGSNPDAVANPQTTIEKQIGPTVIGGILFFKLLDGSAICCNCICEPYSTEIIKAWKQGLLDAYKGE